VSECSVKVFGAIGDEVDPLTAGVGNRDLE
jgi:hypothetical protein